MKVAGLSGVMNGRKNQTNTLMFIIFTLRYIYFAIKAYALAVPNDRGLLSRDV